MQKQSPHDGTARAAGAALFPDGSNGVPVDHKSSDGDVQEAGDRTVVRIELPQADIILSIIAKHRPHRSHAETESESVRAPISRLLSDPVIERLLDEIQIASPCDEFSGAISDATEIALISCRSRLTYKPTIVDVVAAEKKLIKWKLRRVLVYVDDHISEAITLAALAEVSGLSKMYFAARFRAATGMRPHEYVMRRRISIAKTFLETTLEPITHIAGCVGFQTQAHFTTTFKRYAGQTPARWRAMHLQEAERPCSGGNSLALSIASTFGAGHGKSSEPDVRDSKK